MFDNNRRKDRAAAKQKVRDRINAGFDRSKYKYIPEEKPIDYYDNEVSQRVGIYVRVSTDDVRQTTSYELQKKYYEDFVQKHPHWKLYKIYADEGISGTSTTKREAFNEMIADAKAHKIDLIITKSVSRFARNVRDFLGAVRDLADQKPAVGVFFESEAIFSLNEDSQMALTFQSTMAEEESHTRSRSMESSLRMRLDNGLPLTPPLLGYLQNADGHLVINPDEKNTVKLAFYMYLYPAYITRYSSLSFFIVSIFCFSKYTLIPLERSIRTYSRHSTVLRANRDTHFVMMWSILPLRQSSIILLNSGRLSALVPLMPSSAYRPANSHSLFELMYSV